MRAKKNLAHVVGIAAVLAGVAVAGPAKADLTTISIFGWTDGLAPTLLATGAGPFQSVSGAPLGGATFTTISGAESAPNTMDLAQTITLNLTAALPTAVHIAVEVAGLGIASGFPVGNVAFTSGFGTTNIDTALTVVESTNLGSVCTGSNPAVGGTCTLDAATNISNHTFTGPLGAVSANETNTLITSNPFTVFDEFTFTGGAAGGNANVNISLHGVPGPVVGAGLPGLLAACGGLLGLARRRRRKAAA